jgi:hypothetical protein
VSTREQRPPGSTGWCASTTASGPNPVRCELAWKIAVSVADATDPLPQSNAAAGTGRRPGQHKSSWTWV